MAENTQQTGGFQKPTAPLAQEAPYSHFHDAMQGVQFDEAAYREALGLAAGATLFGMTAWALISHLAENDRTVGGYVSLYGHTANPEQIAKWIPVKFPRLETIKVVLTDIFDAGSIVVQAVFNGTSLIRVEKVTMLKGKVIDGIHLVLPTKGGIDGDNMRHAEERIRTIAELYAGKPMTAISEGTDASETTMIAIFALKSKWRMLEFMPTINWFGERGFEGDISLIFSL